MKKVLSIILIIISVAFVSSPALAISTGLEETAEKAGVKVDAEPAEIIGQFLKVFIGFLGIVLLVVIIYGGFLWMTAGGDETQVEKAKAWILNGIIGLIIVLLAYAVTDFVVGQIIQVTGTS